ncbi:MAG: SBBP repeat-containing protein [Ferruginibacter sp.]
MKKNICKKILLLASLIISMISYSQVQEKWVARTQNSSQTTQDVANDIKVDAAGNVYIVGTTEDRRQIIEDDYRWAMVTIKYDKFGTLIWKRNYARVSINGSGIVVDPQGNVYVVGYQHGAPSAFPKSDFTTVKYNSAGELQWANDYNGPQKSGTSAYIGLDAVGDVYIAGTSRGVHNPDNSFNEDGDYVVVKYSKNGPQIWEKRYNGAAPNNKPDDLRGMKVDPAGNVYVTGSSQKDGRISPATIKYNKDGVELWVKRPNLSGRGNEIALDPYGNVYITGGAITIKYNSNGDEQWVSYFSLPNHLCSVKSLVVDNDQNSYVVGYAYPNNPISPTEPTKIEIVKYNASGVEQWVKTYNSNPPQELLWLFTPLRPEYDDYLASIAMGTDGNIYITTSSFVAGNRSDILTLKYSSVNGGLLWEKRYNGYDSKDDNGRAIWLDEMDNVFVTGGSETSDETRSLFTTIKYTQCNIVCPPNITVNNDPGRCDAIVRFGLATYTGDCGNSFTYSQNTLTEFPVGVTTVTATSDATGATCSFTVTVVDNENPVITSCPVNKTIDTDPNVCFASASSVNAVPPSASDNCNPTGVTGVRSDGASLSANYPAGTTTITWTANDPSGNTATCLQTITVVDNQPPVISGEGASLIVLSPSNHTMRDVTIDYVVTDNCDVISAISVESNEPVNGTGDGDTDPDWIVVDNHHVKLRAERSAQGNGRIYTVTITATDPSGNTDVKTIDVRVPHDIKNPHSGKPFIVNSTVPFDGEFWDKPGNRHTAKWLVDGSAVANGTVTEPTANQNGKITGSYKFNTAGVYKLQMNVIDQAGVVTYSNTQADLDAIVVIYDPNGGYTYGGGWFASRAGALVGNSTATGKASYGFAINYRNAAKPKGETQFEFKVGDFEFNALNFDYLVVSGFKAQFRGTGKIIGGQAGINFIMTIIDGDLDGSGIDKIRLKIFKNNGQVMYDNQPGAGDADNPTMPVGSNSIIFIQGAQTTQPMISAVTNPHVAEKSAAEDGAAKALQLIAYPNPSSKNFMLKIKSNDEKSLVQMQVTDAQGRVVEARNSLHSGMLVRIGNKYKAGSYYVKVLQGAQQQTLLLVKLSE